MTPQGQRIFNDWATCFRDIYVRLHPGCNENDVERAMLNTISVAFFGNVSADDQGCIDNIKDKRK